MRHIHGYLGHIEAIWKPKSLSGQYILTETIRALIWTAYSGNATALAQGLSCAAFTLSLVRELVLHMTRFKDDGKA